MQRLNLYLTLSDVSENTYTAAVAADKKGGNRTTAIAALWGRVNFYFILQKLSCR